MPQSLFADLAPERRPPSLWFRGVMFEPTATFVELRDEPVRRAFFFGFVCLALVPLLMGAVMGGLNFWFGGELQEAWFVLAFVAFALLCGPALLAYGGLLHLIGVVVNAVPRGFGATLRAVSLAQAPMAICVVGLPFCLTWTSILVAISLREVHGVSAGRARAAVLLSIGVVIGVLVGGVVALLR